MLVRPVPASPGQLQKVERHGMRPLPELTPATEWFWRSGADGKLRIQGCSDCGQLVHPPVPICPRCRSRASAPVEVSGRATVVGLTVNVQPFLPGFDLDPPYVIANVALEEDAERPAHDQHRRLRSGRRAPRPGSRGHLRAARRRLAAAVHPHRRPRHPGPRCRGPGCRPRARPSAATASSTGRSSRASGAPSSGAG